MNSMNKKRVIIVIFSIIVMVSLIGCQPTPEETYIDGNNNGNSNNPQTTFSRVDTPKTVKETVKKGKLSLEIDAKVTLPDTKEFFLYPANFFDFDNEAFRKKAISILFGSDNINKVKLKENKHEYYYTQKIGDEESSLCIDTENNVASFSSYLMLSGESIEENMYTANESLDIGMTEPQAVELAQKTVKDLGFKDFKPVDTTAFGKLNNHEKDYYEIVFERYVDDTKVVNVTTQHTAQDPAPLGDEIYVTVGKGGVWHVSIYVAQLSEKTESVTLVGFKDVLANFKQSGLAKLSQYLAMGEKLTVTEIQLSYVYAYSKNNQQYTLIPAWVFFCEFEDNTDGQTSTYYMDISFDARNGSILN